MYMRVGVMDSVYEEFGIFGEEYPDSALRRIFYLMKEFHIPRRVFAIC